MLRLTSFVLLILSACLPCADTTGAGPLPGKAAPQDRIVVLISVDGLASYYLDDPRATLPTIRRLAKEGATAGRMQCSLPTVTWPNHTTLVTGVTPAKHGVIGNSVWDREKQTSVPYIPDPLFNKDEIVKVPTIYDAAHAAGLKTAGVIWPASRGAASLDWTVPDVFSQEIFNKYSTQSLLAECRASGIEVDKQEEWCKTGKGEDRDIMYARLAAHIIQRHKPNLLLLHLIEVDHVEHAKGPQSPEAYKAVAFADERVKVVVDAVEKTFPGRGTIIVASDHGFVPYQQQIQPNVKLRQAGLLTVEDKKITDRHVSALGQGGSSFIYIGDKNRRTELLPKLNELFRGTPGIEEIITPDRFAEFGLASPDHNPFAPDMVLTAHSGFTFSDNALGEDVVTPLSEAIKGSHGHNQFHPLMHGSFVAWGAGIRSGAKVSEIRNVDVTPTIARLLGLKMAKLDGKMIEAILLETAGSQK